MRVMYRKNEKWGIAEIVVSKNNITEGILEYFKTLSIEGNVDIVDIELIEPVSNSDKIFLLVKYAIV